MKYIFTLLLLTLYLDAQLLSPTIRPQFVSGRATYNNNVGFIQPMLLNRMMPYATSMQNQQQPQSKQPLRAHNNRYPVNRSNTMGFGGYERINLRNGKAQALAAQQYKTKLAALRINLRAYRIQPVTPTNPTTPEPQPQPQPQPPTNGDGEVGIGGGPGPVPPSFPEGPPAVGMPAPQPR